MTMLDRMLEKVGMRHTDTYERFLSNSALL